MPKTVETRVGVCYNDFKYCTKGETGMLISLVVPCYNEEENARPIYEAVKDELERELPGYDYEILFIDNKSTDGTRCIIEKICEENPKVKAIFKAKNFGQFNTPN